jgi:hypothetical protein
MGMMNESEWTRWALSSMTPFVRGFDGMLGFKNKRKSGIHAPQNTCPASWHITPLVSRISVPVVLWVYPEIFLGSQS